MMNRTYNRYFLKFIEENRIRIILVLALTFVKVFIMAMIPKVYQTIIDMALFNSNMKLFIYLVISLSGLYLLEVITGIYKEISVSVLNEKCAYYLKKKINDKMLSSSYADMAKKNISEITSLLTNETKIVSNHFSNGLFSVIGNVILFIVAVAIIIIIDWRIFLLTMVTVMLYIINGKFWSKIIKETSEVNLKENGNVIQIISDNYNNLVNNKMMNLSEFISNRFKLIYNGYYKSSINQETIKIKYRYISMFLIYVMMIVIWLIGGIAAVNHILSIGTLTALISYPMILGPVQSISNFVQSYNTSVVSLIRLDDFFNMQDEFLNLEGEYIGSIDKISLRDVEFKYHEEIIISNINISIEKGDVLGIEGESGVGKSTLLKILSGLYKPTKGEVIINNYVLSEINKFSLYGKIAYIEQDSRLFNGSINENIDLGRNIEAKNIHDVLNRLNLTINNEHKFLDYHIKDSGDNLSGGQKKRIEIARSLIMNPEVILLDESLSALDKFSKKNAMDYVLQNYKEKIIIIVSHNKEDLKICNKFLILQNT